MLVRINGYTWNTASPYKVDAEAMRLAMISATGVPWVVVEGDHCYAAIPAIEEDTDDPLILTPFIRGQHPATPAEALAHKSHITAPLPGVRRENG